VRWACWIYCGKENLGGRLGQRDRIEGVAVVMLSGQFTSLQKAELPIKSISSILLEGMEQITLNHNQLFS